ncbi:TAFII28-domain-containing protein [Wallemia mellicola]|uniref:Transcription initiation factor TFIID subunit 11 n=2 Tax=Wallemia mellicola TaxID=1708541 RepID=I4YGZ4_WALMC|nr:TAFII28-domain-containing protein [Wallemia mellicola CBS 633.66]TIB82349.1 TAFII28-domain-containing protein [Wallemia mellicola]EIM23236.1 TAFII28-domain-containing protein [Wallemia mellicola CBS 633.66]TIB84879.1 TAFII28-domain-containing protein [Wallemia mellicola]TIB91538.1 TAFII28-domain-containing protein [Wallemia mellicola]TIC00099.1 TAFII28-domain-containing protein [Wallemia mellicola]|eukprot:XP_006956627.1 TAFII28-domain-containing protein [Wallemia mellicola CBS 633.66]
MQQQKRPRSSTPGELSFPGTPQTVASPESKKGRGRPRKTDKDKKGSLSPTLPQNELEPAQPQQQQKKPEEDDDDEIEDDWMEDDDFERERVQSKKAKEDLGVLLQHFSSEQLQRYEVYRRAALNKNTIRKLCNQTLNQSVSQNVSIIVSGFSKVFVGEIVEKAREVQEAWGQSGPLSADQIREAHRLYQKDKGAYRKPFVR